MTDKTGVALVTGAGSGLGRALAMELAARGMKVAGFGRRMDALEAVRSDIGADQFLPISVDVSDFDAVAARFQQIRDHWGAVSVVINNAAVYPHRDLLEETPHQFMKTVGINLGGTYACAHHALLCMKETGVGHIVNVSSFADVAPLPASAAYSVSKGAQRILSRALVADLADRFPGIIVTTWMPGILATDMGMSEGLPPEVAAKWGAELAMRQDTELNGKMFEMSCELPEGRGLKRRVKDLVLMRRRPALITLE